MVWKLRSGTVERISPVEASLVDIPCRLPGGAKPVSTSITVQKTNARAGATRPGALVGMLSVKALVRMTGVVGLALIAACGEPDTILSGERLSIRDGLPGGAALTVNESRPIALPAAVTNAAWTHRGGDADHLLRHPALPGTLTLAFATGIGAGDSRGNRITADPVVEGGRIFTLDASSTVSATSTGGATAWRRDVSPASDRPGDASGGGLAVQGNVLIVTTGFGEVIALDAASGGEIWRQDINAPATAAPTIAGGIVYAVGRDSTGWALDLANGRVRWQIRGVPSGATFSGGAGAAVGDGIVVFPFSSGELLAAFPEGGLRRWSSVIAGERLGQAAAVAASDIAADPVIDGGVTYAGNLSGRVVAMQTATGERLWTATEGATSPVIPVGGSVFLLNDINQLVRLDAASGAVIWRTQLPLSESRGWFGRSEAYFAHYGPVLAGGRLVVASSDGVLRQFDPVSGAALGQIALPGGAASAPVVAGNTLYVVSQSGQLLAYR